MISKGSVSKKLQFVNSVMGSQMWIEENKENKTVPVSLSKARLIRVETQSQLLKNYAYSIEASVCRIGIPRLHEDDRATRL